MRLLLVCVALLSACKSEVTPPGGQTVDDSGPRSRPVKSAAVGSTAGQGTAVDLLPPAPVNGADPRDAADPTASDATMGDAAHGDLAPAEPPPPHPVPGEAPVRPRHRLDLDQLDASLQRATGFAWTELRGGVSVNLFQDLSLTLGKPNYRELTIEDLEPSVTFQKFLDDAARSTCGKAIDHDVALRADAASRFLIKTGLQDTVENAPDRIDENLRTLLRRFHGKEVAAASPALVHWRWLFQTSSRVTGSPVEGWRAVCVALVEHPDFYSY